MDMFFKRPPGKLFFWSLGTIHLLGWGFLLFASGIVRRKWQDRPATLRGLNWRNWRQGILEGNQRVRDDFRRDCLNQNAFYWLATRPRSRAWWTWTPLAILVVIWAWAYHKVGRECFDPGAYAVSAFLLSVSFKAMVGAEAGRRILEDRKIGALELLLSTPLSVREIFRGQYLSLARQFAAPLAVMLVADLVMLIAGWRDRSMSEMARGYWLWIGLGGMVMFATDLVALYWLGMWSGLSSKNPRNAFGGAIVPILTLPWVATALVMTTIGLLPHSVRRDVYFESLPFWLWFGFSLLADLGFGFYARHRLLTEFRHLAAQRFQPKPSLWRRLTGRGN
jgi:hypothetical protein